MAGTWHGPGSPDSRSGCAGCADFGTGLPRLEVLQHHSPAPRHEVPSRGQGLALWDKIPVQEPVTGLAPQSHSRGARIYDGDWQCPSEADTEQHHRWERGHVQGEAMLPRDGGSGYLPYHPRERTGAALPTALAPCSTACISCQRAQRPAGTQETPEWLPQPGPGTPSCCAHGTEQTPAAKSPCSNPSPANPRPSSSKHPTLKEQHHHGHNRTPAASTQGKGQPQTPETSLPQPRGARNGAKLAPGPPASPTAIGNLGWALPPATRPQPRSRHKQGNKNPFGKSSPCSQRIISQLKGHKGI